MKNSGKTLDQAGLEKLALRYVERYATTQQKLARYLSRKVRERGWHGQEAPEIERLVESYSEMGYIDDALFAQNKATSLMQRGYGSRRVSQALYQAGISEEDSQSARKFSQEQKWAAAEKFARKRSIGPFALEQSPPEKCKKQLQAFLRAGHDFDLARRFVFAQPGENIDQDE